MYVAISLTEIDITIKKIVKTFKTEALIALITKMGLAYTFHLLNGQK